MASWTSADIRSLWGLFALWILFFSAVYKLRTVGRRPKGLPPGPPTLPIIGNIHQIPTTHPHKQYQTWANQYGPIYSLMLGTRVMIVLSSDRIIKDLLDKKSAIYSDRPEYHIGQEVLSGNNRFVHLVRFLSSNLLRLTTAFRN